MVQQNWTELVIPVMKVCGVRYSPSAHFTAPSNAAHATPISRAMGKCAAMMVTGRRMRTAHAAKAQTGAVNTAQLHQPLSCHAMIHPQGRGAVGVALPCTTW